MTKTLRRTFFLLLLAALLVLGGCAANDAGDDGGGGSVDAPETEALSSYSGSDVSSETEAKTLFTGAASAITTLVESGSSSSGVSASDLSASYSDSGSYDESFDDTIDGPEGGTATVSGSATGSYAVEYPEGETGEGSYLFDYDVDLDLLIEMSNLGVSNGGKSYTLNGTIESDSTIDYNLDFTLTEETASGSYAYDYSFGLVYGATVENVTDGVGGKFVLYVSADYQNSGDVNDAGYADDVTPNLTATLEVYNNSNTLLYESTLTPSELTSVFPFIGDFVLFS